MNQIFEGIRKRWAIIKINTINSWQEETAHFWNNWGNFFSTLSYTIVIFSFYHFLIYKFKTIAGYNIDQFLVLSLFGQIFFYTTYGFFKSSVEKFITAVKQGNLDFVLLRPMPHMFYISFRRIPIVSTFRDSAVTLSLSVFIINWSNLHLNPYNIFIACVMFFMGLVIWHCIIFISAFTIFWLGESKRMYFLTQAASDNKSLPYDGFPKNIRLFLTFIVPSMLAYPLSVSIILGRSTTKWFFWSLIAMFFFLWLKNWVWKQGLKAYTSAS